MWILILNSLSLSWVILRYVLLRKHVCLEVRGRIVLVIPIIGKILGLKILRVFQTRRIIVDPLSPYSWVAYMRRKHIWRVYPIVMVRLVALWWHVLPLVAERRRHYSKLMWSLDLVPMIRSRIVAWVLARGAIFYVLVRISERVLGREIHHVNV